MADRTPPEPDTLTVTLDELLAKVDEAELVRELEAVTLTPEELEAWSREARAATATLLEAAEGGHG